MGCLWFDEEDKQDIPQAVLISEGTNAKGNYVVYVNNMTEPVRARNVEIAFLDTQGEMILFSAGKNTTSISLDRIYFTDVGEPGPNYQVVYYDFDGDDRLAERPGYEKKDNFLISPNIGTIGTSSTDIPPDDITLVLIWKSDTDQREIKGIDEDRIIGRTLLAMTNGSVNGSEEADSKKEDTRLSMGQALGLIMLIVLLVIMIVIFNIRILPKLRERYRRREELRSSVEDNDSKDE